MEGSQKLVMVMHEGNMVITADAAAAHCIQAGMHCLCCLVWHMQFPNGPEVCLTVQNADTKQASDSIVWHALGAAQSVTDMTWKT